VVKGNNTWKEKGKSKPFTTGADGAKEAQVGKDTDFLGESGGAKAIRDS